MDPFELISSFLFFILIVVLLWRVPKLKPLTVFYLIDYVCYKPPFSKPDPKEVLEIQPELYSSPNEFENVVFEMVDELLNKTKAHLKNIGVLVCVFNGSSMISLSSMVMKKYKLKEDIASYDLNGKGCNSGLMAITLAKQLLQVKHDCLALVLSTEELPEGLHVITEPDFLYEYQPSGVAILLSNCPSSSAFSKFKLIGTHNVHITVTNDATSASEKVVRSNSAFSSLFRPCEVQMWCSLCQASAGPMVAAVERELKNARDIAEDSRMVRSWFGYEPVSSLWYKLFYIVANGRRFEKGDILAQMALWSDWSNSSGSTLIWQAIGDVDYREKKIKPMLFKMFGDVNFRQLLPKVLTNYQ